MNDAPAPSAPEGPRYEEVTAGHVDAQDLRITAAQLRHQAAVARDQGNPQLAANLERAAELSALSDEDLLMMYETLRPGRSSGEELRLLSERLEREAGPLSAQLVREALHHYERRGLLRPQSPQ